MSESSPVLIHSETKNADYSTIHINTSEFVIGRAKASTFNLCSLLVSKTQCVFQKNDDGWMLCDKSTFGTYVNGSKLEKDFPVAVSNGDKIEFGPTGKFKYTFCTDEILLPPPNKKCKMNDSEDSEKTQQLEDEKQEIEMKYKKHIEELQEKHKQEMQKLQIDDAEQEIINKKKQELEQQQADEKRVSDEKLQQEKKELEDKIKQMQNLLQEKEKAEELLNIKLKEKEEERLRDLKQLQEQRDEQVKAMLEKLQKEVAEREEVVRVQLAKEIQNLQEEKTKLEEDIRGELSKKEGESAENLKRLQDELDKIKRDLSNVEGKKQYLEKELEETAKAKEEASESCLKAKQEVLHNFGELMETELQCSVCNELFVTATTLNCTHTFCKTCITEWKKKKKDCPICRTKITSENRSIALDNFIDKMVSNLSEELRNRRQEIVEEREAKTVTLKKSSLSVVILHRGRGRGQTTVIRQART